MAEKEKRLLDLILCEIEKSNHLNLRGHWTSNSHWSEAILAITDMNTFARSVVNATQKHVKNYIPESLKPDETRLRDKEYWDRRRHVTITYHQDNPQKTKIDSNEVFIERLLTYINNDCEDEFFVAPAYWNQYQVGKHYKEAVDIRIKDGDNFKYVELKVLDDNNKADNPLFAIIESIKNYYLSSNSKAISELIILAPIDYWEQYLEKTDDKKQDNKVYLKIQELLNAFLIIENPIVIKFQYIACKRMFLTEFLEDIKRIKGVEFKPKESKIKDISKRKYTHAANYELKKVFPYLLQTHDTLKDLLEIKDLKLKDIYVNI